jgi:hypothetical protein
VRLSPASPPRAFAKNTGMQNDPVAQRSSSAAVERFPSRIPRGSWLRAPSRRRSQWKEETGEREAPTRACGSSELAVRAPCSIRQRPSSPPHEPGVDETAPPPRFAADDRAQRQPPAWMSPPGEQSPRRAASSWEAVGGGGGWRQSREAATGGLDRAPRQEGSVVGLDLAAPDLDIRRRR